MKNYIGYLIGIVIIILMYVLTLGYRKAFRKKINKKEYRLWVIYGLAMFLTDKTPIKKLKRTGNIDKSFKKLSVGESIETKKYLYIVNKVAICIVIIFTSLILGTGLMISENDQSKNIEKVHRNQSSDHNYNLIAKDEKGNKEEIILKVKAKELTVDETYKLFDSIKKPFVKKILNKNKSLNNISTPLNLINKYGDKNIQVNWSISDSNVLDYDGTIGEDIDAKGETIKLTATFTLNKVTMDYSFFANIMPNKATVSLQEKVQDHIEKNGIYQSNVQLPDTVNGKKITYSLFSSNIGSKIFIVGLIIAVVIFFLKDRDLKKDVEQRDKELLREYPEIVSKILLYYKAGLSLKSSLEKIIQQYKKGSKKIYAYEELNLTVMKIRSGVPETTAINEFGKRCNIHCYIKLANIIEQNIKRGTKEMSLALKTEVENALIDRKNNALIEGNEISTKLLGPMVLMLGISIAIIIIPAFMSMNL